MLARIAVPIVPLFATLLLAPSVPLEAQTPERKKDAEIVTHGSGDATLSPQRAVLRIGMTTRAPTAAEASSQNARILNAVLDTLRRAGFPRDSLQTVAFGVGPNYDYEKGSKLVDYEASAAVRLTVRDLTRIGRIIDQALAAGATDVGNLGFESDSLEIGRRQALRQALGKARGDAEALARAAGGSLGRLVQVIARDNYFGALASEGLAYSAGFASMRQETSIMPRDVIVRLSVEAHWEFVPGR